MSNIMIRAENISKYYRLGTLGSGRLREDLKDWWKGRESGEQLAALKNISFEVTQGEVLGFLGKNGAGKSTLLKIISRITLPTTGNIKGKGRIASLLEVGTGFHGELTGRENIFLNGHILGMKKKEIIAQFDRIVDFSGVEKFIDTPVKRYSSGMYVRLAFAVAAHLNPEILVVDEVLAVGDAEFQQKCIGKMKEVSAQEGRTVLFVSHNMQALRNLCHRAISLHQGEITDIGAPGKVIANYLKREKIQYLQQEYTDPGSAPGNDRVRIKKVQLLPEYLPGMEIIDIRTPLLIDFEFWYDPSAPQPASSTDPGSTAFLSSTDPGDLIVGLHVFSISGDCIFDVSSRRAIFEKGVIKGQCRIPGNFLNDGSYYISIVFVKNTTTRLFYFESCLSFDVEDYRESTAWYGKRIGHVRPAFPVTLQPVNKDDL
jgi:lipopolysaccharide transport system ATP-binding protein